MSTSYRIVAERTGEESRKSIGSEYLAEACSVAHDWFLKQVQSIHSANAEARGWIFILEYRRNDGCWDEKMRLGGVQTHGIT